MVFKSESGSVSTDRFNEYLLIKCRLVNSSRLQLFTSNNKSLYKRVRKQLGWSKVIANVALNAYNEFLELKVITRDFEDSNIVPSWCVREVWKTHALCDTANYEDGCKGICGHVIKYQVEVKPDPEGVVNSAEQLTEGVYKTRFNRNLPKPIWAFKFNPLWKNEFQIGSGIKHCKQKNENGAVGTEGNSVDKGKKGKNIVKEKDTPVTPVAKKKSNVASFYRKSTSPSATVNNPVNSSVSNNNPVDPSTLTNTATPATSNSNTVPEPDREASVPVRRVTFSNSDVAPGPSSQNEESLQTDNSTQNVSQDHSPRHTPQDTDHSTLSSPSIDNSNNKRKGTKRNSPLRNPIMTRSRTKVLKIDL